MMDYTIVPTNGAHIPALAALEDVCFSTPWTAQGLAEELENPQAHFLTALVGETVAGYIGVQEICGEGYVTNVAVLPEYRRRGIGRALLCAAIDGARARGCAFLTLEVRPSNTGAIRMYESLGFSVMGRRKSFYRSPSEDALIYTLFIKEENA